MKPIDFRNETFESLRERVQGLRLAVWQAWLAHGPGTTRDVAARAGIDILTFRPRTTELFQLGFLEVAGQSGNEGIYRARTEEDVRATFEASQREQRGSHQPEFSLHP